jgi:hypothetical protein
MESFDHKFYLNDGREAVAHVYYGRGDSRFPGLGNHYFDLTIDGAPAGEHVRVKFRLGTNLRAIESQVRREYGNASSPEDLALGLDVLPELQS